MAARPIRYGTPVKFRPATHAQLERFDNKPPPQPLQESEPTAITTETTQNTPKFGKLTEPETKPEAAKMRDSEGKTSAATGKTTPTETAVKYPDWIPDRGGGWNGTVTKYDASTMYLG